MEGSSTNKLEILLSRKNPAVMAFFETVVNDEALFCRFWARYYELLQQTNELEDFEKILNEIREEKRQKSHDNRLCKIKSSVLFVFGFALGAFLTFLFGL